MTYGVALARVVF